MNFLTNPYKVVFYEKVGCKGNDKQKKLLLNNGISFQTKDLLNTKWDKKSLKEFFIDTNKEDMINKFAPKIKKGQLDISQFTKDELITLMCEEPILIKRPLLEIGVNKICGFDIDKINQHLNTNICEYIKLSTCQSSTLCNNA